jgi:hypothetical protein
MFGMDHPAIIRLKKLHNELNPWVLLM